jgi:hypothetical protein
MRSVILADDPDAIHIREQGLVAQVQDQVDSPRGDNELRSAIGDSQESEDPLRVVKEFL